MTNANRQIAVRQITPDVWQMIGSIAPTLHQARLFGISSPEQAAAIVLKGYELGLSFTSSLELIQVVEGKPTLSPRGALALVLNSPVCEGVKIDDLADAKGAPAGCKVWMKRVGGFEYTVTWTMEDAKRAGLIKPNSGWEKYPAQMLKWRAVGFCADVVFPDVIGGMKRADEYGADLTPDGDVIEGNWTVRPVGTTTLPPAAPCTAPSLTDLVSRYGAQAVMDANDGRIPATDAETVAVAAALEVSSAS
jgi:hypothetical protein